MHPTSATTAALRRPALVLVALTLSALLATAVGLWAWRTPRVGVRPTPAAEAPRHLAARDEASTTWRVTVPVAVPAVRATPNPSPAPEPSPDWSALAIGIAPATAAPMVASAAAPADLAIAMSSRERRALIASAREPEGLPAPEGYRPGIAVIVPGGSHTDGVCR